MKLFQWPEIEKERLFRLCLLVILVGVVVWVSRNFLTSPRPWFDEGVYVQAARHLVETGHFGLPIEAGKDISLEYITVGFPVLVPVAVAFSAFGASLFIARAVAVFFILLAIASGSFLIKKLYGRRAATWSALLAATFSPLYGHGKNLLGEVPGLAYLFISLCLFDRFPFLFGIFFGLAVASKPTFLPLLPALAFALFIGIRRGSLKMRNVWRILGGVSLMLLAWVWTQFRGEGFVGVLGHYANPYHLENMTQVVLTNVKGFFLHTTTLHLLALVLIAVSGFFSRGIRRLRLVEWTLIVFMVLIWASYFRTAGWYRYFFPAHLPLLLLAPAMLMAISRRVPSFRPWMVNAACVGLLAVNIFTLAKDPVPTYGTTWQDVVGAVAERPHADVMYLTAPEIAVFHPDESFRQYLDVTDALHLGEASLKNAEKNPPELLIVAKRTPQIEPLLSQFRLEREYGNYSLWLRK